MNDLSKATHSALCALLVATLAACVQVLPPPVAPTPSAAPTDTAPPITTTIRTSTPWVTSTQTPLVPTRTPFRSASITPISSPTHADTPFVPFTFKSIQMMDLETGWAVADIGSEESTHILRTADGGATWQDVSPADNDMAGSFFLDSQFAWAWSWGPVWRTQDGGASWTPMGEYGLQPDLGFVDSQHGWKLNAESWGLSFVQFDIVSFSITQDGGMTWQELDPPPDRGSAFMAYPSAQSAWAVRAGFAKTIEGVPNLGIPFHIQRTLDGGVTWITQEMPLPPDSFRIVRPYEGTYLGGFGNCDFVSPVYSSTAIWKLALTCEDHSWMYTSATQGKTWIISDMPAGLGADIDFIDASTGWVLIGDPYESPEGHFYQTTDGGQSWTLLKRTGWTDAHLSFADAQTGWAVACTEGYCYQRDTQQALITTIDGGQTWQVIEPQLVP